MAATSAPLPRQIAQVLTRAGIIARRICASTAIPREMIAGNGHWGYTFDKIHLFGLHEFSKLVDVDSDMIVLANMDGCLTSRIGRRFLPADCFTLTGHA